MKFLATLFNLFRFNQKNWKAVVLCLVAATIFWFFNALNKNYSANISFPIAFEYDEEGYIPVKPLPHHIRLNVSGLGWDLFRRSIGLKVSPLNIPLENPAEVKKIVGTSLPALFSPQLEGIQINFVLTDTLHLQIDPLGKREVMVRVESVESYLRADYGLSSEVLIQPDVVMLEGPLSLLRTLPDTLSISLPVRNIDRPYKDHIEIEMESELINLNPPVVQVSFSVDKMMELTNTIDLKLINLPKEVRSVNHIKEIGFTYSIPTTLAHTIMLDSMQAVLDLSGMKRGRNRFVPVITGLPPFCRITQIDTVDVNF